MVKIIVAAVIIILIGYIFFFSGGYNVPMLPQLSRGDTIVAFGDSLTFGFGADPEESYPAVLSKLTGFKVINAGVSGEISETGMKRLPGVLDKYKPDLLILCHGGNDILRNLDPAITADNIQNMIKEARKRNISVIILGVPKKGLTLPVPTFYKELADKYQIPYEPDIIRRVIADSSLKSDYIHPNAKGYEAIAKAIKEVLVKAGVITAENN